MLWQQEEPTEAEIPDKEVSFERNGPVAIDHALISSGDLLVTELRLLIIICVHIHMHRFCGPMPPLVILIFTLSFHNTD